MEIIKAIPGERICIGRRGEHLARQVQFDLTPLTEAYGEGRADLLYLRPNDQTPYPVPAERQDDLLLWTISNIDTAQAGEGRFEIRYSVGEIQVIPEMGYIVIESTLENPDEVPEPPGPDWFAQVLAQIRRIEAPITHAPIINDDGMWMIWNRETDGYEPTGFCAVGKDGMDGQDGADGKDGITPYIGGNGNWFAGETDTGIAATGPQGPRGLDGPEGPRGPRGYDGEDGADGMDGMDGADGADGADGVGIESIAATTSSVDDGYNSVTIFLTDSNSKTFRVKNGSKGETGPSGADGKDYLLTDGDKSEIASLVLTNFTDVSEVAL